MFRRVLSLLVGVAVGLLTLLIAQGSMVGLIASLLFLGVVTTVFVPQVRQSRFASWLTSDPEWLFATLFVVGLFVAGVAYIGNLAAVNPAAAVPATLLLILVVTVHTYASMHSIAVDKFLVWFWWKRYRGVKVSETYADTHGRPLLAEVTTGIWGFAYLPWPFFRGRLFPTSVIEVLYLASRSYLKGSQAPMILTTQAAMRLGVENLRHFVQAFPVLNWWKYGYDLSQTRQVQYMLEIDTETGQRKNGFYPGMVIGQVISDETDSVVLETVRKIASHFPLRGGKSITGNRPMFEHMVILELSAPESPFAQGDLLDEAAAHDYRRKPGQKDEPYEEKVQEYARDVFGAEDHLGSALAAFDFNLVDIKGEGELQAAMALPAIGKQEGQREGNRLAAIAARSGMSAQEVRRLEAFEKTQPTIISGGNTIGNVVAGFLGRAARPPQAAPPQQPAAQQPPQQPPAP